MSDTNNTRRDFESWFSDDWQAPKAVTRKGERYELMTANHAWWVWQAATERAIAIERERCAVVCQAMTTVSGTDDVERGWNAAMRRVSTAIRQGGAG